MLSPSSANQPDPVHHRQAVPPRRLIIARTRLPRHESQQRERFANCVDGTDFSSLSARRRLEPGDRITPRMSITVRTRGRSYGAPGGTFEVAGSRDRRPLIRQIRMYDVGFGDCFLVRFPSADHRERLVLIDCGVHFASQGGHPIPDVIARSSSARPLGSSGRPASIDIVCDPSPPGPRVRFETRMYGPVEVGEVWLPWTEDPDDEDARINFFTASRSGGSSCSASSTGARSREWRRRGSSTTTSATRTPRPWPRSIGVRRSADALFLPEVPKSTGHARVDDAGPAAGVKVHILGRCAARKRSAT